MKQGHERGKGKVCICVYVSGSVAEEGGAGKERREGPLV